MKLFGFIKTRKEYALLKDAYETLDSQLQFVTRENENLRKANNSIAEQMNGYKGRIKDLESKAHELNELKKKYEKVCQDNRHLEKEIERLRPQPHYDTSTQGSYKR